MARYHWSDSRMPAPYDPRPESVRSAATGDPLSEADARRLVRRMDADADVATVARRQASTSHVRRDATESERVARKGGVKRVTTRSVRHVTTITRSSEQRSDAVERDPWPADRCSAAAAAAAAAAVERQAPAIGYHGYRDERYQWHGGQAAPRPPERYHRRAKVKQQLEQQRHQEDDDKDRRV